MRSKAPQVHFVYEAGPCGYAVYRYLTAKGLRMHDLSAVHVPDASDEAFAIWFAPGKLTAHGKPHNAAIVAVARELTGFIWDIARLATSASNTLH